MRMSLRAGAIAMLIAAASLLASTLGSIARFWRDIPDYEHGWLIAGISVVWCARLLLRHPLQAPAGSALPRLLPLTIALFAWLVAKNAHSQIGAQLLAPPVLLAAVYAIGGRPLALRLAPPLGFLYFAIPVWDYALPVLQRASVFVTEGALGLLGVPAEVSDYTVHIPEGTFEIIEGCSGKRYFMVALALGVLAAAVNGLGARATIALVVAAGLLSLLANYVRIVLVIYAGHVTAMQHYWVAVEHKTLGNVIFGVLIAMILVLGHLLAHRSGTERRARISAAAPMAGLAAAPLPWTAVAPTALLLGAAALLAIANPAQRAAERALGALPVVAGTWSGPLPADPGWQPRYVGASEELRASYRGSAEAVEVYVNRYHVQADGSELIQYDNKLLGPGTWSVPWSARSRKLATEPTLALAEALDAESQRWVVAHYYEVGSTSTTSDTLTQWLYGLRATFGRAPAGVTALAVRCEPANCEAARARVIAFWNDMGPALRSMRHRTAG